jgi:hypothetical protein
MLHYLDDLDSKMECMRSVSERDRAVEGCFTGYIPSLERAVLKKEKYLRAEAAERPARPAVNSESAQPPRPAPLPSNGPSAQPPRPAPDPSNGPRTSPFGEKLLLALKTEGKQES